MKKVVVIGGGIIGCFIAHEVSKHEGYQVVLIERNHDVCEEISAANSAIIHAGYDPNDGTLKAMLNQKGAAMYPTICKELHVAYQTCGAYILACGEDEEMQLDTLYERGKRRHIRMEYVTREELLKQKEPISDAVTKALSVPDTAIITPWEVGNALMEEAHMNGVDIHLKEEVQAIVKLHEQYEIQTNRGSIEADIVINAAGLGAQHIMKLLEPEPLFETTLKRGQYYILSKKEQDFTKSVLYPTPSVLGKGVLCLPTVHGNILLGPNSEVLHEVDTATTSQGLMEVRNTLSKTVKNVPYQEVIHSYSGLRPTGNQGDFYINESENNPNVIHLGCIDSPGLASAPAIAEYVLTKFIFKNTTVHKKSRYYRRLAPVVISHLADTEKQEMIQQKAAYGHIICRCEEVSEQEIVDCIRRPFGATTIKGVKKRVRPGMGRCQGGFCEAEVAKILARELKIPLNEVCYDYDSYFTMVKGER